MSAANEAHFLREPASNEAWVLGFGLGLASALLACRRDPWPWLVPSALVATLGLYALLLAQLGAHPAAIVVYLACGAVAYRLAAPGLRPLAVAAVALWSPALHLLAPTPAVGPLPSVVGLSALAAAPVAVALLRRGSASFAAPGLLAVAATAAVYDRHLAVGGVGPDDVLAAALVIAAPLLARLTPGRRDAAATVLGLLVLVSVGAAFVLGKPYGVDPATVPHHAAELLLAGRDPYAEFDLLDALARFGVDPEAGTHLEDRTQLRSLSYPALSFLLVTPFVALGLADIRPVYLAVLALCVPVLASRLRFGAPIVAAAVLGDVVLMRQHVLAGIDPAWILLMLVAFLYPERRWVSAVALGLALADRQPAWALAPFAVLAVWRTFGLREALRRGGIALAVALAVDLPFLLRAPGAFVSGVLGPIVQPLQPAGVGLVRIGLSPDFVSLLPRGVHAALVVVAFVVAAALLWRGWRHWSPAARVAGSVPLWVAWRSLMNYLAPAPLFALPVSTAEDPEQD